MNARHAWNPFALLTLTLAAAAPLGCAPDDGDPAAGLEATQGAIQAGQLETGYPAVGLVSSAAGSCTGALIAPSYVLTAKHCAGANMTFKTGNDASSFVSHVADAQLKHPTLDMMIVHLFAPIDDIPVMKVDMGGSLPGLNTVCTGVGFGAHTENGTTTSGVKRSATEKIIFADNSRIDVEMVSGIEDSGDSGGPLICNGLIEGVVLGHADGNWPQHRVGIYTTEQPAWVQRTIAPVFTDLTLRNGWAPAGFGTRTPGVGMVGNNVVFKGTIAGGTSEEAFSMPAGMIPSSTVYIPVDMCDSKAGRIVIRNDGSVQIQGENGLADAACFTSLEGVSFARYTDGYTPLTLKPGWALQNLSAFAPAVANFDGVVRFQGAMKATGTEDSPFSLPAGFRPASVVYLPITLCSGHKGQMVITPAGAVGINADATRTWADAQCFTSLDGASFQADLTGNQLIGTINGWTNRAFSTDEVGVKSFSGVAHLTGGIKTTGTNPVAFKVPVGYRPMAPVLMPITLCNAAKGRLSISTTGDASVSAEGGAFSNAQCFTSVANIQYAISDFTPMVLENGWKPYSSSTPLPGASGSAGIVQLKGAIRNDASNAAAFTLPAALAPTQDVYVPINLCNATKGRLYIQPSGAVSVNVDGGDFSQARCFTSLDGASFAQSTAGYTALSLKNGWTNAPFGTRNAASTIVGGIVHLAGAIATSGTNAIPFVLPAAHRPSTNVYVPIDLCGAGKGRLLIQPNGTTTVQADNGVWSNAQCFTSLDGATFAATSAGFTPLTLKNGWTNAPFSTRNAAAQAVKGIVRLQGAIASGTTAVAFTLPTGFRPTQTVYVAADLCGAAKGRLMIQPSGDVSVQVGEGTFSNAQCFTSLEGVWFEQ